MPQRDAPLRIARLVRVSTQHLEQADSPQHQLAYIDEEAKRAGWLDTGLVYQAELTGAVIMDRPDIQRMIADAQSGRFDAIVLKSISRLGRDTLGLLMVKRLLDDHAVELIALADGYRSFRDPELIFLVYAERAQAGRQEIAKNVRAGIVQAARRGIWPAGTLPFGLRKQSRFSILPDPETAPIVRLIFALRARHWGLPAICKHLNQDLRIKAPRWWHLREQIRALQASADTALDDRLQARLRALRERLVTKRHAWQPRTLRLILANSAYCGLLRYNCTTGERRLHGRLVRRRRDPGEWVEIPCPPLVSRAEWEAAQVASQTRHKRGGRRDGSGFLLSGLCQCGVCGAKLRGVSARSGAGTRGGDPKGYYVCRGSLEEGAHPAEYLRARELELAVVTRLRAELRHLPQPSVGPAVSRSNPDLTREAQALEAELLDTAEARFFRREELRRGQMSETDFRFESSLLERREAALRERISALRDRVASAAEAPPADEPGPALLHSLWHLEGPAPLLKRLLPVLVSRVVVHSRRHVTLHAAFTEADVADAGIGSGLAGGEEDRV